MIKVNKLKIAPSTLSSILKRGIIETKKNCDSYDIDPILFSDANAYVIKSSIYNAPKVKSTLKTIQKNKCCFCEKKHDDEYGAVEHFRPKLGYQLIRGDALIRPGYYWQGYSWENLFYVCTPCNTAKGNIFPLKNEANRSINHKCTTKEDSLLLNPAGKLNPRKHIKFVDEVPYGISDYGIKTIEVCELDRYGLNQARKIHLLQIKVRIAAIIRDIDPIAVKEAKKYLRSSIKNDAQFSAMVIDFINLNCPMLIK